MCFQYNKNIFGYTYSFFKNFASHCMFFHEKIDYVEPNNEIKKETFIEI